MPTSPRSEQHAAFSRREALLWLSTAGLVTVAAACRSGSNSRSATTSGAAGGDIAASNTTATGSAGTAPVATTASAAPAATPVTTTCVLSPEQTEGPYYIAGEAIRTDITEGKAGMPLRLAFLVLNVNRCAVIANASVDIWHADATGSYSGFNAAASNRTFLRGIQVTDATGAAGFHTIYPGWYQGRATHIHVKVYVGGTVVHTGQVFFDEAINQVVYATAPYNSHTGTRTLNSQENIYANGGAQSLLRLTREGSGYLGTITLGLKV